MSAFRTELKKSRRRFDLPVTLLISLVVLIWAAQSAPRTADNLAEGYSALYYAIPLMNTTVMPLGMMVLASRIWDAEAKGACCKLLFTLQSRGSLFCSKAALGIPENLLVCLIECGGILLLGRSGGYTEAFDLTQFLWLCACTFAVNTMLYFCGLFLAIRFSNQIAVMAVGIIGSLSGLFAAFLPKIVSFFLPWGYYIPLMGVQMIWDFETRIGWFEPVPFRFWLLGLTLLLAVLFGALGWNALRKKEV